MRTDYRRHVLALTDEQLELFLLDWVGAVGQRYVSHARFSGPGDGGRDVVGFLTSQRFDGPWHNYQCKQYAGRIPTATGILEIGKILYNAHAGLFSAPDAYYFVAPRGLNRNLEALVYSPSTFKRRVIDDWDKYCATEVVENQTTVMTAELRAFIEAYDFSRISRLQLEDILTAPEAQQVLSRHFGADPGPSPLGVVPAEIQPLEQLYVAQLVEAYAEADGATYNSHADLPSSSAHAGHLAMQRERFFDTEAFKRFYRDSTDPEALLAVERDVLHGVIDCCALSYGNALARVNAVLAQAATIAVTGVLMPHTRVSIKQGYCHHFANDHRLLWKR